MRGRGQRFARSLSDLVFDRVFPRLARAVAAAAPTESLQDVRDAALVLLYRLLFILYAEDRALLPVGDPRYDAISLRRIRRDIGRRKDRGEAFSATSTRYSAALDRLCRAIDAGDPAIGLPPCGGLFDPQRAQRLRTIPLGDGVLADVIDVLSFEPAPEGRKAIDYRDLSVQQLGGIYERLLELELVRDGAAIVVRPDISARRTSGSYYTPDDLVALIIRETVGPLVAEKTGHLHHVDRAERLLELKVCDPAMGAGHFLVGLIDFLTDRIMAAMADAACGSPLCARIASIRSTIRRESEAHGFAADPARLDDRHIVRRMVAARCVYGVDKNPMAVELARTAVQLHTFIRGAPPVFVDHHLRCGDSLFGLSVRKAMDKAAALDAPTLLEEPAARAAGAADAMRAIDELAGGGIADAQQAAEMFAAAQAMTAPLDALLSLLHAADWLNVGKAAVQAFAGGRFRNPVPIALGAMEITNNSEASTGVPPPPLAGEGWGGGPATRSESAASPPPASEGGEESAAAADLDLEPARFADLLRQARHLIAEEHFFNWEAAFPEVWPGGFDAIIGNPPWDRMKLQQVEWFAARRRDIAFAPRAADRTRMIAALAASGGSLALDYAKASARAEAAVRVARASGDYPVMSGGDVNLYSLFVERAMGLVKPRGLVGLLVPSGIASDRTAAPFFRDVATRGRLKTLYDFENRRTRSGAEPFFPEVDGRFKFCVFVASPTPLDAPARCAFFLHDGRELADPERCLSLTAEDFARVNPNTSTAPAFRTRRDADLTIGIYNRVPVLAGRLTASACGPDEAKRNPGSASPRTSALPCVPVPDYASLHPGYDPSPAALHARDRSETCAWPVRYTTMFHMTNDSRLFRTRAELVEKENARPAVGHRWRSERGLWLPLYEGKMAQAFDHRAAGVAVNPRNRHRPAQPQPATLAQHQDPAWLPEPQYWVEASRCGWSPGETWVLGFKEITSPTNERTFIAALFPAAAFGNKVPLLRSTTDASRREHLLCANLNSIVFDFVARQKIHGQTLNRFIVEQLPVIPPDQCGRRFGDATAAQIVTDAVLELTYTSHDMAPFAADMGFVDGTGAVRPPFAWDEERRLVLRAKLDAVYFHLYGVTGRDDVRYIYSTFPTLERNETARHGGYLSRDLCLKWMDLLETKHGS